MSVLTKNVLLVSMILSKTNLSDFDISVLNEFMIMQLDLEKPRYNSFGLKLEEDVKISYYPNIGMVLYEKYTGVPDINGDFWNRIKIKTSITEEEFFQTSMSIDYFGISYSDIQALINLYQLVRERDLDIDPYYHYFEDSCSVDAKYIKIYSLNEEKVEINQKAVL